MKRVKFDVCGFAVALGSELHLYEGRTAPFIEWRRVKSLKVMAADPPLRWNGLLHGISINYAVLGNYVNVDNRWKRREHISHPFSVGNDGPPPNMRDFRLVE